MRILIVGANGQIGKQVVERLQDGPHEVRAMVRNPAQATDLEVFGAEVVVADLEEDISYAVDGCDAVLFTAGSGSSTGPDKTELVDHLGAIKTIETAEQYGASRFVMVSTMWADEPEKGLESIRHYFEAKGKADDRLRASDLVYTIVRPGRLTNEPATQQITVAPSIGKQGTISRADVALTLVATFDIENTTHKTFDLLSGDMPIEEALRGL